MARFRRFVLLAATALVGSAPVSASTIDALLDDPGRARSFDYCDWRFAQGGKEDDLPDFESIVKGGDQVSRTRKHAAVLVGAGTRIALAAKSARKCKRTFADGLKAYRRSHSIAKGIFHPDPELELSADPAIAEIQVTFDTHLEERRIARWVVADIRNGGPSDAGLWAAGLALSLVASTDRAAADYLKQVLDRYDWVDSNRFGPMISEDAFAIAFRADEDLELQKRALSGMEKHLDKGGVMKPNYARLWDRVAVAEEREQRYGTQPAPGCGPLGLELEPMEDPDNVDRRRSEMELGPLQEQLNELSVARCGHTPVRVEGLDPAIESILDKLARKETAEEEVTLDFDSLSPEERSAVIELTKEFAASFFITKPIKRLRGDRFTILTDLANNDNIQSISSNLDATFAELEEMFERAAPEDAENIPVYVYRAPWRFAALASAVGTEDAAGIYIPDVPLLAFGMEAHSNQTLASVIIHEATHAYVDHHIRSDGVELPFWLDEGLAEYVSNSEIRGGKLLLGTMRRKQRIRWGNFKSDPYRQLEMLRTSVRKEQKPDLRDLLTADRATFYGDAHVNYAASWMLVHFLRHSEGYGGQDRLSRLIETICHGADSPGAIQEVYGDLARFETEYRRYIREVGE